MDRSQDDADSLPDWSTTGSSSGGSAVPQPSIWLSPGTRLGPYQLTRRIGSGAFGEVWQAWRESLYVKDVAIKFIDPGILSEVSRQRFEREARALALMEHRNIAKVLDGDVTEHGIPYLVMELVRDGRSLTTYCDEKRLSIDKRLILFEQACDAVEYVHRKQVVHRDLKPANILAFDTKEEGPSLKVIDFGLAKLTETTERMMGSVDLTGRVVVGTRAYMSPEQASGVSVDARSDVYSLGVVLYELLCGTRPFEEFLDASQTDWCRLLETRDPDPPSRRLSSNLEGDEATDALIEALIDRSREERRRWLTSTEVSEVCGRRELQRPSWLERLARPVEGQGIGYAPVPTVRMIARDRGLEIGSLRRKVRRELDWIVLKALERDPDRRYQSVRDLKLDIRSYLDTGTCFAGPDSTAYRVRKYVRRHRAIVLVMLVLVIGLGTAVWLWQTSERLRTDLARQKQAAEALAAQLRFSEAQERAQREVAVLSMRQTAEERDKLTRTVYALNLGFAGVLAEMAGWDGVRRVLDLEGAREVDGVPLRNWEWGWLSAQADSSLLTLKPEEEPVAAAFSPDGRQVLSWSWNGLLQVWDASTGEEIVAGRSRVDGDPRLEWWSDDGTRLLLKVGDRAELMDGTTGALVTTLAPSQKDGVIDGGWLRLTGLVVEDWSHDAGGPKSWSAWTGEPLEPPIDSGELLAVSRDSRWILTREWDDSTTLHDQVKGVRSDLERSNVWSAVFSPQGNLVLTWSEGVAELWECATGDRLATLQRGWVSGWRGCLDDLSQVDNEAEVHGASFSEDGLRILTFDADTVLVWSIEGTLLAEHRGHRSLINSASFSPSGDKFVTASRDGSVRVWDAWMPSGVRLQDLMARRENESSRRTRAAGQGLVQFVFVGSGEWFSTRMVAALQRFQLRRIVCLPIDPDALLDLHVALDGGTFKAVIMGSDGALSVWDGTSHTRLSSDGPEHHQLVPRHANFSDDASKVVTVLEGDGGACLKAFETQTGELLAHIELPRLARWEWEHLRAEFSPDATRILTSSGFDHARLWDLATGLMLAELPLAGEASFSLDGTRIVGDGVWDAVPYRIRHAERRLREQGRSENLGARYLRELRGIEPPTWLSDPSRPKSSLDHGS